MPVTQIELRRRPGLLANDDYRPYRTEHWRRFRSLFGRPEVLHWAPPGAPEASHKLTIVTTGLRYICLRFRTRLGGFLEDDHQFAPEFLIRRSRLFPPSQIIHFLRIEVQEIKKAVRAFYRTKDITDIGSFREQVVNGFN